MRVSDETKESNWTSFGRRVRTSNGGGVIIVIDGELGFILIDESERQNRWWNNMEKKEKNSEKKLKERKTAKRGIESREWAVEEKA